MPYNRISAFGVSHGNVTPEEEFNARNAAMSAARQAQMEALREQIAARTQASSDARYGIDATMAMNGTFADRAQNDTNMLREKIAAEQGMNTANNQRMIEMQDRQMGPANRRAALDERIYNDQSGVTNAKNQMIMEFMKRFQGGGPDSGMTPEDQKNLFYSIMSGAPMQDPNKSKMIKMEMEQKQLEMNRNNMLDNPQSLETQLTQSLGDFGTRDAATFGWDPNGQDVNRLDALANRYAQALMQYYPGVSAEQAKAKANEIIMQALEGPSRSLGTGWIQQLMAKRGIQ